MRLASYRIRGGASYGIVTAEGVIDLKSRLTDYPTLRTFIAGDQFRGAEEMIGGPVDFAFEELELLPTILDAEKYICIGINYAKRETEYKDGAQKPRYPSVFMRTPDSFVGHETPLVRPLESEQLDYEGEIGIIIGKGGRRIPENRAESHIAGLTVINEGSVRDWLRHAKFNVTQGKNFVHSGSMGPWMVTADELAGFDDLRVRTRVNGELRQDDTTANLMFPFRHLISYLSTVFLLKPGDVIATGTPNGAGARFDPPRYLKPGDVVEVSVPGVGLLRNGVTDETA